MSISATATRRERKMQETSARIVSVARRLTAEHGLGGFTIEQVCEEVDVSRRTFFNYFPSKEDAIFGGDMEDQVRQLGVAFLARGSRGWGSVIDDLVDLVIENFETAGLDAAGHGEFLAAVEREPRLLIRLMGVSRDRDRQAAALVAEREGLAPDDPRAVAAVTALSMIMRTAGDRFFDPANTADFADILKDSLAALRVVFVPPSPRKAQP